MAAPIAQHVYTSDGLAAAIEFLKRTRFELRELRKVRVWKDKLHVIDINGDYFEVAGIGYEDPDIIPVLNHINTNFKPETIHEPTKEEFKEFKSGRRRAWAEDRVM